MLSFPLPLGNFLKNALCQFIMTNQDVRGSSLVDALTYCQGVTITWCRIHFLYQSATKAEHALHCREACHPKMYVCNYVYFSTGCNTICLQGCKVVNKMGPLTNYNGLWLSTLHHTCWLSYLRSLTTWTVEFRAREFCLSLSLWSSLNSFTDTEVKVTGLGKQPLSWAVLCTWNYV